MSQKIGFIGGGNMAVSLIGGLINRGNIQASNVVVFEPNSDKAQELKQQYGCDLAENNSELVATCDAIVIAVKPQVLQAVLSPLQRNFLDSKPLIISVVAGIKASSIESWLGGKLPVVRVMPNTPALIGMGASGMFANNSVSDEQKQLSETLMSAVGSAMWVPNESDIDSVTALSGSGPAYFMLFIKSLIEAAEQAGMNSDTAKSLAVQTAIGAAELVASSDQSLQTLIDNVTSPNGTTECALMSFEQDDLKGVVTRAFEAARLRSQELADELG